MAPGKAVLAIQPVLKVPDDPITQSQAVPSEDWVQNDVQGNDLADSRGFGSMGGLTWTAGAGGRSSSTVGAGRAGSGL